MGIVDRHREELDPAYVAYIEAMPESVSVEDCVLLYGRSDIDERNETFEVPLYMPGWLAIGDDGGGRALLMRCDGSAGVYICDHGAMDEEVCEPLADIFADWLEAGCPLDE